MSEVLLYVRGGSLPCHTPPLQYWGMIPANDGSISIRFLAKMQELRSAQISLNGCK